MILASQGVTLYGALNGILYGALWGPYEVLWGPISYMAIEYPIYLTTVYSL